MAAKKSKKHRGPGRPRTRGETVSVTVRLSKDLSEQIDRVRRSVKKALTRTEAIERVLRRGLE